MLKQKKNHNKKIIIWGFEKVGRSTLNFLSSYFYKEKYSYIIIDRSLLSKEKISLLHQHNAKFILQENISHTILNNSFIIPSPGVDITNYYTLYKKNFITELDLFHAYFHKPTIAITGSVGKTSITTICASILKNIGIHCFVGGNIGTPMFEGIKKEQNIDCALLELSSFQLEHSRYFAPDIAILTNIYPNHLDRHATFKEYINAKLQIFSHQHANQYAILPLSLYRVISQIIPLTQKCIFFSSRHPTEYEKKMIKPTDTIIFIDNNIILSYYKKNITLATSLPTKPSNFFPQNWIILYAILYALKIPANYLHQKDLYLPEHRLEYVATHNTVTFYNDSKSTTPSSTQAAVAQFLNKKIHLFLGGLSKGIDRETFIMSCKNRSISIYCFGKESKKLSDLCTKYGIITSRHDTLEASFNYCMQKTDLHNIVLFSPSGSSFDLYSNYEERGHHFKKLVSNYIAKCNENTKQ